MFAKFFSEIYLFYGTIKRQRIITKHKNFFKKYRNCRNVYLTCSVLSPELLNSGLYAAFCLLSQYFDKSNFVRPSQKVKLNKEYQTTKEIGLSRTGKYTIRNEKLVGSIRITSANVSKIYSGLRKRNKTFFFPFLFENLPPFV